MQDQKNILDYPPGIRPHKAAATQLEHDEMWTKTAEQDYAVTLIIPKDATRRTAMLHVHWKCAQVLKSIECESSAYAADKCATDTKISSLKTSLKDVFDKYSEGIAVDRMETARRRAVADHIQSRVASDVYLAVNKKLAQRAEKDEKDERKQQAKDEAVQRQLLKKDPVAMLDSRIDRRIIAQSGAAMSTDTKDDIKRDKTERADIVEGLRYTKQKTEKKKPGAAAQSAKTNQTNGSKHSNKPPPPPPPPSWGQKNGESLGGGRGKGKGKGKTSPKGKGKDNAQKGSKGKGKQSKSSPGTWKGKGGGKGGQRRTGA
jgi:hypothetical protein